MTVCYAYLALFRRNSLGLHKDTSAIQTWSQKLLVRVHGVLRHLSSSSVNRNKIKRIREQAHAHAHTRSIRPPIDDDDDTVLKGRSIAFIHNKNPPIGGIWRNATPLEILNKDITTMVIRPLDDPT